MRKSILTLSVLTGLMTAAPALAGGQGFDAQIDRPLTSAVKIEVVLSESLQYRADALPKTLAERGAGSGLRGSGFAQNGHYGEKDLQRLVERTQADLTKSFARYGIEQSDNAPVTLRIVLEDVKNNRPTFEQLKRDANLSFESFGVGGAELSGALLTPSGDVIGEMSYQWYDSNIEPFGRTVGTWTDAHRAIRRFSKKAAKSLT